MRQAIDRVYTSVSPVLRTSNTRSGIGYFLFALVYIMGGDGRSRATAYGGMKTIMPMKAWGLVFLVIGISWVIACYRQDRKHVAMTHWAGSVIYTFIAASFGVQAILFADASFAGVVVFSILSWAALSSAGWISKESQP